MAQYLTSETIKAAAQFSVGGPAENEHNYCHKCRGKLIELLPPHYGDLPTRLEAA